MVAISYYRNWLLNKYIINIQIIVVSLDLIDVSYDNFNS